VTATRRARLEAERRQMELLSLRSGVAALRVELAFIKVQLALRRKDWRDQPRVAAGNPDAGQWTSEGGGQASDGDESADLTGSTEPAPESEARVILAGGFTKEELSLTVDDFVAQKCEGRVRRVLPGQFLESTIGDVMGAAKSGDAAARRCLKLLREDRFRK
jgi:hypothetical protein